MVMAEKQLASSVGEVGMLKSPDSCNEWFVSAGDELLSAPSVCTAI